MRLRRHFVFCLAAAGPFAASACGDDGTPTDAPVMADDCTEVPSGQPCPLCEDVAAGTPCEADGDPRTTEYCNPRVCERGPSPCPCSGTDPCGGGSECAPPGPGVSYDACYAVAPAPDGAPCDSDGDPGTAETCVAGSCEPG